MSALHAGPRPLTAWMSTKFPLELPAAFGLTVCCPESAAAAAAMGGNGFQLCRQGETLGYCGELCSYVRMGMALATQEGEGGLPRPDFLLCCDNICSGMVQWYEAMSRALDVPLLLLNIPYHQETSVSEETTAYLRRQLEGLIRALEQLTGQSLDLDRLRQVCRQANRNAAAWQKVLDTATARPSPLNNMEIFQYMPLMVTGRCSPETENTLTQLARELRTRTPAEARSGDYRIFWEGTPCWPRLQEVNALLEQRHIQVVADTISHSLSFRYKDLDGLVRAYCGTINGVSLEEGVSMRADLCRRYQVEGVLVHYNRSCRPWCGQLQEVERRLRQSLGLPVVSFSGDQGDPGVLSLAQLETRLDSLTELMEARREAKRQS